MKLYIYTYIFFYVKKVSIITSDFVCVLMYKVARLLQIEVVTKVSTHKVFFHSRNREHTMNFKTIL